MCSPVTVRRMPPAPARGGPIKPAKTVCRLCLVRDECLDYAIENHEPVVGRHQ